MDYAWFFIVPAVVGEYSAKDEDITVENQHSVLDI